MWHIRVHFWSVAAAAAFATSFLLHLGTTMEEKMDKILTGSCHRRIDD
jgi:hypothetical protein